MKPNKLINLWVLSWLIAHSVMERENFYIMYFFSTSLFSLKCKLASVVVAALLSPTSLSPST